MHMRHFDLPISVPCTGLGGSHVFGKLEPSGPAYNAGLCVNDVLLIVNECPARLMRHGQIVRRIKEGGDQLRVVVRYVA